MEHISVKQLADKYGVDRTTVYKWIKRGMPSIKIGGTRRFKVSDVEEWIKYEEIRKLYDVTAGDVETPLGVGKYIAYDKHEQKVTVEMDHRYIVVFNAKDCVIRK